MCPTYTFIDRANGKYNNAMDFKKDYGALISYAWDIDNALDQWLNNRDESSYDSLANMGLTLGISFDDEESEVDRDNRTTLLKKIMSLDKNNKFRARYVSLEEDDME